MTDSVESPDPSDPSSEWDVVVEVTARVRVTARPNPDRFEGWADRDPEDAAETAVLRAGLDLGMTDGFADLVGEVYVEDVWSER